MFEFEPPADKESIVAALGRLNDEIGDYFASLPADRFLAPQGTAWSPAGHLQHLIRSVTPVARAMRLPRLLLALRFGRSRRPSDGFERVRERYQEALAAGLQAGRYGPPPAAADLPAAARRGRTLSRWRRAGGELVGAAVGWRDADLDRYRLPHPGLGNLTLREMLFFTLYHNAHHARRVHQRATAAGDER